jgi:NAD+ kinase
MKKVVILGNRQKSGVLKALESIEPWLSRRAQVNVDLDMEEPVDAGQVDFAVVLGGDGSMLRAARKVGCSGVPLLGINVGKFGFLTEGSVEDFEELLSCALDGRCRTTERMMLHCTLERDGAAALQTVGLNDAVISRTALSRAITMDVQVNGTPVTTYRADGLIIATPVGSTAHCLAAGGPIIYPHMEALVMLPICPHTLSNRPLVLPAQMALTIAAREAAEPPALTVDGQVNASLEEGDLVRVRKADAPLKLLKAGRLDFFETLRNKLDWRGQPRYGS